MKRYGFDAGRLRSAAAFAFRLTAAALVALWLAYRLQVTLPLWSALTALVVTQVSVGRSLRATFDYFAATIGGVIWGALVAVLVPHSSEGALLFVLALAVAPLAFIAAFYPRLAVGPVTATIVVLVPQILHTSPIGSALDRVIEVGIGGITGLVISFVLIPWSAFRHTRETAAKTIELMANAVPALIEGFERGLDETKAHRIQDGIGQQLSELTLIAAEAEHERPLRLSGDPLTGPLLRTSLRLRHDLVMIGRAARWPLPPVVKTALQPALAAVGEETKLHLQACAAALLSKRRAPSRESFDSALTHFTAGLDTLRRGGQLREMPIEALEPLFATGFALEQMHRNLEDLARCVDEWAAEQGQR
jgi:uncharacterized membrane protein YccC